MQAMMGMDFGFTAMPVEVAGEGREAGAAVAGLGEGVPEESNEALLAVWAMMLQQQLQPVMESAPAGVSWEGESEEVQEVSGREGEEQPRRVSEMWGGVVGATVGIERMGEGVSKVEMGGVEVVAAGMDAVEEVSAGRWKGDERVGGKEGLEQGREAIAVVASPDGASVGVREPQGLLRESTAGVPLAGRAEDQRVEARVEGVRPEGREVMAVREKVELRGVADEQAEAAGEQLAVPFRTVVELERNWRAGLWKQEGDERGERKAEPVAMGSGQMEESGESKPVGKEMEVDDGGPVREEGLEWEGEPVGKEAATGAKQEVARVVEERQETRERDEPRPVGMQPALGEGMVREARVEVMATRAQASEGRPKAAEMAPAPRPAETENFVLPGPAVSPERKTIAIRIPLSESNVVGATRHLDIVFEQKRNDLTLQIHSPSLELQREVESAMPSLMERLRGENWSAKAAEPVTAVRSGDGAAELVRAMETPAAGGAVLESLRETVVNQNASQSGFSFEDAPRQRGEQREEREEPNAEREETWRDEFVEQLGA
jgi:hypothetical protein